MSDEKIEKAIKTFLGGVKIVSYQVKQGHISGNEGVKRMGEAGLLILQGLRERER